jgi:hypothetical protein
MSFWDDDFTGTDGDTPSAVKWRPQDSPIIFSNKLKLVALGGISWIPAVYSTCALVEDFSVEVSYDLASCYESGIPPATGDYLASITAWIDSTHYIYVGVGYNAGHFIASGYANGGAPAGASVTRVAHSGWLKITRVGDTYSTYATDGGGAWAEIGTSHVVGVSTDVMSLYIAVNRNVAGDVTACFDDFKIVSGTPTVPSSGHDILGYINNPYWTETATETHAPCGYWRKNLALASIVKTPIYADQTSSVFDPSSCVWVAHPTDLAYIASIITYHDELYGVSFERGDLYKWNGSTWVKLTAGLVDPTRMPDSVLTVSDNKIYCRFTETLYSEWVTTVVLDAYWEPSLSDFYTVGVPIYYAQGEGQYYISTFIDEITAPAVDQDFLYANRKFELLVSPSTLGYYDGDGIYIPVETSVVNSYRLYIAVCGDILYGLKVNKTGYPRSVLYTLQAQVSTTTPNTIVGYKEVVTPSVLIIPDAVWPFTDLGGKKWGG